MGDLQPRVGGVLHNAIASWAPVTYSFDVLGCKEASWSIYLAPGERHPALYRGALVELMDGLNCIWAGVLSEPNWRDGRMTANGIAYEASRYPALDGAGNASANPTTVASANQTRGWPILGVASSVPNAAYTATADGSNTQTNLFDANSDELGQRWYVGADRILRFAADPTEPTWHIRPQIVDLGLADDNYLSTANVRYQDTAKSYATAQRTDTAVRDRFGYRGLEWDVTDYGLISAARANAIGDGILAKGRARMGWTSTIEVTSSDLSTAGGNTADLTMVEGGRQALRVHDVFDDVQWLSGRTYLDVVIGESTHTEGSGVVSLNPVGKVAETPEEVAEEQTLMALGVRPSG